MIRVLIVDDLAISRQRLARLLSAHSDVTVVGEADDWNAGIAQVLGLRPDLLFLDIGLPNGSGLDLARAFPGQARPGVVFLTAYPEHALSSWEVGAIDYLLKPLGEERLALALERARATLGTARASETGTEPPIAVQDGRRTSFVAPEDIDYVDVAGHYLCLHAGRATHLLRQPLAELGRRLAPADFVQVHRSVLVPRRQIVAVENRRNGDAWLTLRCGARVPASRSFRHLIDSPVTGVAGLARLAP